MCSIHNAARARLEGDIPYNIYTISIYIYMINLLNSEKSLHIYIYMYIIRSYVYRNHHAYRQYTKYGTHVSLASLNVNLHKKICTTKSFRTPYIYICSFSLSLSRSLAFLSLSLSLVLSHSRSIRVRFLRTNFDATKRGDGGSTSALTASLALRLYAFS